MGGNGNGAKIYLWIFSAIVFPTLFFIGNNVIVEAKESRSRDVEIQKEMIKGKEDQQKINQEILLTLRDIQNDVKYIKKERDS